VTSAKYRKRDIAFHNEGIEDLDDEDLVLCDCGHTIEKNRCCKHHILKKKTEELRYDHSKAIRMCFACHTEIEAIGNVRWAKKHRHRIQPWVYERLMRLCAKPSDLEEEPLQSVTLSDIL
jgi:hypothetical protein